MSKRFNGELLTMARQLRKSSQAEVVRSLKGKVTQGTLSKIEHGMVQPSDDLAMALAAALRVRKSFFFDATYVLSPQVSFHRKRQKLSPRDLDSLHAQAEVYRISLKKLMDAVELEHSRAAVPAIDPDTFGGKIAVVANAVRQHWGLPKGPLRELTKIVEDAGVIVIPFDFGTQLIDGFSHHPADGLPATIYINNTQPKDRYRFSLAHELAHLVMHQTPNPEQEIQANRFASELLVPSNEIRPHLHNLSLQKFMDMKLYWGVSMQSLIYKAWEVGAITDRGKKYYFIEMSKRGFREKEPIEIKAKEDATALRDLLAAHVEELGYSPGELSELFGLEEEEVSALYPLPKKRPHLRLVVNDSA